MPTWGWSRWTELRSSKKVTIPPQMRLHLLSPTSISIPHRLLPLGKVAELEAKLGGAQHDCSTALRSSLDDAAFS
jgi:hypothetical protein